MPFSVSARRAEKELNFGEKNETEWGKSPPSANHLAHVSLLLPSRYKLGGYKYPQGQKKAGLERNGEVNGSRSRMSRTTVYAEVLAANVSPPFKGSVLKEKACPNVLQYVRQELRKSSEKNFSKKITSNGGRLPGGSSRRYGCRTYLQ